MKIWQIVEAPDSGFSQNRTTRGGVIVPDNFDMKNAPLTYDQDGLKYKLEDGAELKNKSPSDLAKELEKTDSPKAKTLSEKIKGWKAGARRWMTAFGKIGLIKISIGAQGAAIMYKYFQDVAAFKEIWAATYPSGHTLALGSPYYQEAADATLKPLRASAVTAAASIMAIEIARLIKAGKAARVARGINAASTPLLAVPKLGWAAKAIIFALTEGAIWAAGWTIQRYGPTLFHYILNNTIDDILEDLKGTAEEPADPVDVEKVKNAIRRELQAQRDGDIPTPPGSDIRTNLRNRNIDLDQIEIPD